MSSEPPPAESPDAKDASASPPKDAVAIGGGAATGGVPETNTLWVGNLPSYVSEGDLMALFAPHGALDCALARAGSRSYAFVLFRTRPRLAQLSRPPGARRSGALPCAPSSRGRSLNGRTLGGKELCVDFQRSKGRAEWSESSSFNGRVSGQPGDKRGTGPSKGSAGMRMREAQPTNVLWVGFPASYKVIDEEALKKAMSAFGVVTKIKIFQTRQYAFVEFASVVEAYNAKTNLDAHLFDDPRIQILFSNSGILPPPESFDPREAKRMRLDAGADPYDARASSTDFLTNVLQVDGPERLYGVVLHIPQMSAASTLRPQLTGPDLQPYYDERETLPSSQRKYSIISPSDNGYPDADYRGSLREESMHHLGQISGRPRVDEGQAVQPVLTGFPTNQTAATQVQSSVKPDIMATLAKLMPSVQPSPLVSGQIPMNSTDRSSQMHDPSMLSKVWNPENQSTASNLSFGQIANLQQPGQQFSRQASAAHLTNYGSMVGAQEHSTQHTAYNPEVGLNLPPPPPTSNSRTNTQFYITISRWTQFARTDKPATVSARAILCAPKQLRSISYG
ncbi:hypothetical protein HU200_007069 [Digitaria exilis]|uniref:RRM domain-containing protein n=1 Tax=Digitaria exilis TaxID=1010633 RepID=A0A835FNW0_9POAL|nr:hypothetical protein HU200_007069 [Digitaria exilis]